MPGILYKIICEIETQSELSPGEINLEIILRRIHIKTLERSTFWQSTPLYEIEDITDLWFMSVSC